MKLFAMILITATLIAAWYWFGWRMAVLLFFMQWYANCSNASK